MEVTQDLPAACVLVVLPELPTGSYGASIRTNVNGGVVIDEPKGDVFSDDVT
jgi:hypothetical protein